MALDVRLLWAGRERESRLQTRAALDKVGQALVRLGNEILDPATRIRPRDEFDTRDPDTTVFILETIGGNDIAYPIILLAKLAARDDDLFVPFGREVGT